MLQWIQKDDTHIRLTTFVRPNNASVFGVTRHIMFGASTDSVRRALISRGASGVSAIYCSTQHTKKIKLFNTNIPSIQATNVAQYTVYCMQEQPLKTILSLRCLLVTSNYIKVQIYTTSICSTPSHNWITKGKVWINRPVVTDFLKTGFGTEG